MRERDSQLIVSEPFHLHPGSRLTDEGLVRALGWLLIAVGIGLTGVFVGLVVSWVAAVPLVAAALFVYGAILTSAGRQPERSKAAEASTR